MKQQFDRNRHRLTETERESIWRAIDEARERPRRRAFPRPAWGIALAAALSAVVAVGIWQRGGPEDPRRLVAPAVEEALVDEEALVTEQVLVAEEAPAGAASGIEAAVDRADDAAAPTDDEKKHAAADPAAPEETPTVASSDAARRAPAAAVRAREVANVAETADETAPTLDAVGKHSAAPPAGEAAKGTMTFEVSRTLGAPAGHGCITGQVTDAETGEPLSFAIVVVEGTSWGAMSLQDGSFTICLPPGAYTLRATYMGYEAVAVAGLVEKPGATVVLDFA
ncbi:MAG: carboxypeptidase-like regulatory domain-containing protein, partial [Candidatus Krumholzibacteriota bacterium]|nr:carboxypeptidase-like regulatory domain-containing protein [Candidatus Krumholzibacteriota bacterium]